ncbi:MAG: hypothetical protein IPL53_03060 [Ignavibacteria bacterium]|nr:hypothetical protein [Ignavibacteria bacterium]
MDQNQPPQPPIQQSEPDKLSTPLTILSFCIPLAGAIIYFMKKDKEPLSAKTACTAAVIGIIVGIASNLIYTIFNR